MRLVLPDRIGIASEAHGAFQGHLHEALAHSVKELVRVRFPPGHGFVADNRPQRREDRQNPPVRKQILCRLPEVEQRESFLELTHARHFGKFDSPPGLGLVFIKARKPANLTVDGCEVQMDVIVHLRVRQK